MSEVENRDQNDMTRIFAWDECLLAWDQNFGHRYQQSEFLKIRKRKSDFDLKNDPKIEDRPLPDSATVVIL